MNRVLGSTCNSRAWKTCMSLIDQCTNMQSLKTIHAIFIMHGLHHNNYALSKLISFCALSDYGSLQYASLLFHQTPTPNSFIYNTLIRAYSHSSQPQCTLHYFHLMLFNNVDPLVVPDHLTFPFVLIACAKLSYVLYGQRVHCLVLKDGLASSDPHIQTALIRLYVECDSLVDARKEFDEIVEKDVVQWNVLLNGYLRRGFASKALDLFRDLLFSEIEPDEYCIATGIAACANLGALQQGMWIHDYINKRDEFEKDVVVGSALVDMYAKCGCIKQAVQVFEGMSKRNAFSWASMIGGYALHGCAEEAIYCLERMLKEDGVRPDGVVLLGVLTACTHVGLEEKGRFLLENMESQYGISPKHEHYSCVVDLLCRAGKLDYALQLIQTMPMKPLASVWGSLLSTCRTHDNVDLAEVAVRELLLLEHNQGTEDDGAYVQLSNIYLNARRNDDAGKIRKIMGDRGIKKTPGCSVIEVNGEVNEFVAGDVVHPLVHEIYAMLDLLFHHIVDHYLVLKKPK